MTSMRLRARADKVVAIPRLTKESISTGRQCTFINRYGEECNRGGTMMTTPFGDRCRLHVASPQRVKCSHQDCPMWTCREAGECASHAVEDRGQRIRKGDRRNKPLPTNPTVRGGGDIVYTALPPQIESGPCEFLSRVGAPCGKSGMMIKEFGENRCSTHANSTTRGRCVAIDCPLYTDGMYRLCARHCVSNSRGKLMRAIADSYALAGFSDHIAALLELNRNRAVFRVDGGSINSTVRTVLQLLYPSVDCEEFDITRCPYWRPEDDRLGEDEYGGFAELRSNRPRGDRPHPPGSKLY